MTAETESPDHYDVIVIGSGAAGMAAACAAAEAGARVCLLEQSPRLGGTGTHALLTAICGLYLQNDEQCLSAGEAACPPRLLPSPFARALTGTLNRLRPTVPKRVGPVYIFPYRSDEYLQSCEALLGRYDGLDVRTGARVVGGELSALTRPARIRTLTVETPQGRAAIRGGAVVDCSGDGVSSTLFPHHVEHELCELAELQCPAISLITEGADMARLGRTYRVRLLLALRHGIQAGRLPAGVGNVDLAPVGPDLLLWKMNLDPLLFGDREALFDLSQRKRIHDRAMADLEAALAYVAAHVEGCNRLRVLHRSGQLGVRETRRLKGLYQLTGEDVRSGRKFERAVAYGTWPMESWHRGQPMALDVIRAPHYDIPYDCLMGGALDNLLFAGRCMSATHQAQASVRVMGSCYSMGEAVGVAAAMSAATGKRVQDLDPAEIRQRVQAACYTDIEVAGA